MKNSKLSSKFCLITFLLFSLSFKSFSFANEPDDIWNINKQQDNSDIEITDSNNNENIIENSLNTSSINSEFNEEKLLEPELSLVGLYDPEDNNLKIDMWSSSDGDQIRNIIYKIMTMNLSRDSNEILKIALLTNSYAPEINISKKEFFKFKIDYLIKNKDLELIEEFILKNQNSPYIDDLIKEYVDRNLLSGNLDKSCNLFNKIEIIFSDQYLDKFKIYCYIIRDKKEEAQLYYDLKKELGLSDKFFDEKFNVLMGYTQKDIVKVSEDSLLNFHLSHRTNKDFKFDPNKKTKNFIWKYLSSYNLLEGVSEIDLENVEKIEIIEKATHEENYSEKELLYLYKRFIFNIDQLLNASDTFNLLPGYEGRALLYQKMLLTSDPNEKVLFAQKLKNSMKEENIENAFNIELSNELKKIDVNILKSDLTTFYEENIILEEQKSKKIKFNNKIIHQSKLLNYLSDDYNFDKAQKDTIDILKKIKSNKNYVFSNKDKMLLDSIRYDGIEIKKKYSNLYEKTANIPTDLQVLINNEDIGMILLRLVEIIGEDKIDRLGTETLYFITTVLNEVDLDKFRNNILLKTLPLKI